MLIENLGKTRTKLFETVKDLTDEQFNQKPSPEKWSIAQVFHHLYTTEKSTAEFILSAIETKSSPVEDKDMAFVADRSKKIKAKNEPPTDFFTKKALMYLLDNSRFENLQAVFNEVHVEDLADKSIDHPGFGKISLKNLVEFIYLHEQRHIEQIEEIKKELFA